MRDIIIASPSDKVRAQLRGFVADMGIMGVIECRSASQTLDFVRRLPAAIIICQRLTDMAPAAMLRLLPPGADMILLISSAQSPLFGMSNVQCMTLPISRPELRSCIEKLLRLLVRVAHTLKRAAQYGGSGDNQQGKTFIYEGKRCVRRGCIRIY